MRNYLINNNSDKLLIFFTGWGCDESEFEHLKSTSDVLFLFDYYDLNIDFDFAGYNEYNLIAFSAGVFIASILNFNIELRRRIAISGNPYLFDEHFGLSLKTQNTLYNITEKNADDFAINYLIKTEEEKKIFHHSKRTIESCQKEFESLQRIYKTHKEEIKDIYNYALFGGDDKIFNLTVQKEFYKSRLHIIKNARHNLFFRINSFDKIINNVVIN